MEKMNNPKYITALRKIAVVLDILATVYVIAFVCWTFQLSGEVFTQKLTKFFVVVNPMTIGAYSVGIVAAVHCKAFNSLYTDNFRFTWCTCGNGRLVRCYSIFPAIHNYNSIHDRYTYQKVEVEEKFKLKFRLAGWVL